MIKVGLFGTGHLGKIHLQQWIKMENVDLVGFFDPNDVAAKFIENEFGLKRFLSSEELIKSADALDIVSPTVSHFELAKQCFKNSKHCFIEKPLASSMEEAKILVKLAVESGVKCQVGHVERFNPAMLSLHEIKLEPKFIEVHRLAQFNPRGTDVSVILDLMIHDLDIILAIVKSSVKRISASGVRVLSDSYDIANARLEFENGCVANITTSRISLKNMRKMRLFQKDSYIGIDFLTKKSEVIRFLEEQNQKQGSLVLPLKIDEDNERSIEVFHPEVHDTNAIEMELRLFIKSIVENTTPVVNIHAGYNAMELGYQILNCI